VLAALALFRFKVGVVPLIAVCAVAGVVWRLLVVGG
jgi:chromate transporter